MKVILIAAMARNRVIGRDGGIPWRLPGDLARFRTLTTGTGEPPNAVVMGRKTWDSIGRPLPDRINLVITRSPGPLAERMEQHGHGPEVAPGRAAPVAGLDKALEAARGAGCPECWVIGGEEIYRMALEAGVADAVDLTVLDRDVEGDTHFPDLDDAAWREVAAADADGCRRLRLERA